MGIRLSDEARRYLATFAEATGATATDCLLTEEAVVYVVPPVDMPTAIGPDGRTVRALEEQLGQDVVLIEDADRPTDFVANALAPAAVYDVAIRDGEAVAFVDEADVGVAIGTEGARVERARQLAARHFDLDDVRVEADTARSKDDA